MSGAFHTPLMQPAGNAFNAQLSAAQGSFKPTAGTKLYSNVTGEPAYASGGAASVDVLGKHMTSSVQWIKQVRSMHRDGARVFVEFGPRSTLTKLVGQILPAANDLCIVAVNPSKDKSADLQLREAAAQLAVFGVPLADFDPWAVPNPFKLGRPGVAKKAPSRVPPMRLKASTFVAPRTKKALEAVMNDGYKVSGTVVASVGPTDAELKTATREVDAAKAEAVAAKREAAAATTKLAEAERALRMAQSSSGGSAPQPAAGARPAPPVASPRPNGGASARESDAAARDALAATDEVSLTYASTEALAPPAALALAFASNRPLLLVDDGTPFTPQLATQLLAQKGCRVVVLSFSAGKPLFAPLPAAAARVELADRSEKTLEAAIARVVKEHGAPAGFVYTHSEQDARTADEHTQLRWALMAAKHLKTHLQTPPPASTEGVGRCLFLAIARMGNEGRLGVENAGTGGFAAASDPLPGVLQAQRGAAFGLCKALGLEWHHVFCRGIDLAESLAAPAAAAAVVREITCADLTLREVGYDSRGQRYTTRARELLETQGSDATGRSEFNKNDVLLVTGGARGITPLCIAALAGRIGGGTFLLVGRSALGTEPAWAAGAADAGEKGSPLEKAALAHLKAEFAAGRGAKPSPRLLNDAVGKVRGIRDVNESMALIQKRGGRAIYLTCDAGDAEKVRGAVRAAKQQHGLTITGIWHAAGVLKDKSVENKTEADFDAVYGVKITGLTNLLSALSAQERAALRHLIVFSSLAGFHGNAGQTDYAMANDALSKMTHRFGALHRGCSARALCFGPWDGGMVTPELKAHFKSQGVQIIPRTEGAEQVAALLTMASRERSQVLVGNWGMPAVTPLEAEQLVSATFSAPGASGFNGFLRSHVIQGKAVLPMTVAVAHMASTVLKAHPGFHMAAVEEAKLFGGVTLGEDADVVIKMRRDAPADSAGKLAVKCQILRKAGGRLQPVRRHPTRAIPPASALARQPSRTSQHAPACVRQHACASQRARSRATAAAVSSSPPPRPPAAHSLSHASSTLAGVRLHGRALVQAADAAEGPRPRGWRQEAHGSADVQW